MPALADRGGLTGVADLTQALDELLGGRDGLRRLAANYVSALPDDVGETQRQTADAFSSKWDEYEFGGDAFERMVANQKAWYLDLYGFRDEADLAAMLAGCRFVLDAGAGKAYKAAWFAELSPTTEVVAADISASLAGAVEYYEAIPNLSFVRCDLAAMPFFAAGAFDYVSCDQVLHHTLSPADTLRELVRVTRPGGELALYVYRRKALPRELVDDHFRDLSRTMGHDELMELAHQVTELGRLLSGVDGELDFPAIPALGIEGGRMPVQRFLYWNFLKCYWNEELGEHNSVMTNYDWYSPSQAARVSEDEFRAWIEQAGLREVHFHREEACYSGRFAKDR